MKQTLLIFTTSAAILALSACASTSTPSQLAANSQLDPNRPTAVDVMKSGGTYEYVKPTEPLYANSSAELAKQFVGRHKDELPEATESTKAVADANLVICRVVKRTHTRLRAKKVCAPKKEWDAYKQAAQDTVRQKQITRRGGDR